ncbi:porin, partial [mine drainage metagenome]
RAFDTTPNGFRLNQAALTVAYLPSSGAGAQVTLIGGSDAKILRNGEIPLCVTSAGAQGCSSSQFDPMTAFAQYAAGSLTVMAGKFPTLAGAEVMNPAADTNISRSILFWDMEPSTLTGLRATYCGIGCLDADRGRRQRLEFHQLARQHRQNDRTGRHWQPKQDVLLFG